MSYQPQEYAKTTTTKTTTITNDPIYVQDQPYYPLNETSSSDSSSNKHLYPSISAQPTNQVHYRTETRSYTAPQNHYTNLPVDQVNVNANNNTGYSTNGLPMDRVEPTQVNYKTYAKSYTTSTPGYQPSNLHVDQINVNRNNNYGYTQNGLPVDRVEFGSMTDDMRYKSGTVGDQFSSAGSNLRGAFGRLGHAIGDFGHGIFSAIDRFSDEVAGNRGAPRKPKNNANVVQQTTEVRQVTQPSQY